MAFVAVPLFVWAMCFIYSWQFGRIVEEAEAKERNRCLLVVVSVGGDRDNGREEGGGTYDSVIDTRGGGGGGVESTPVSRREVPFGMEETASEVVNDLELRIQVLGRIIS